MILAVVIAFTTGLPVVGALNVNTDNQSVFAKKIKSNNSTQGVLQDQLLDNLAKYSLKMEILQHQATTLLCLQLE